MDATSVSASAMELVEEHEGASAAASSGRHAHTHTHTHTHTHGARSSGRARRAPKAYADSVIDLPDGVVPPPSSSSAMPSDSLGAVAGARAQTLSHTHTQGAAARADATRGASGVKDAGGYGSSSRQLLYSSGVSPHTGSDLASPASGGRTHTHTHTNDGADAAARDATDEPSQAGLSGKSAAAVSTKMDPNVEWRCDVCRHVNVWVRPSCALCARGRNVSVRTLAQSAAHAQAQAQTQPGSRSASSSHAAVASAPVDLRTSPGIMSPPMPTPLRVTTHVHPASLMYSVADTDSAAQAGGAGGGEDDTPVDGRIAQLLCAQVPASNRLVRRPDAELRTNSTDLRSLVRGQTDAGGKASASSNPQLRTHVDAETHRLTEGLIAALSPGDSSAVDAAAAAISSLSSAHLPSRARTAADASPEATPSSANPARSAMHPLDVDWRAVSDMRTLEKVFTYLAAAITAMDPHVAANLAKGMTRAVIAAQPAGAALLGTASHGNSVANSGSLGGGAATAGHGHAHAHMRGRDMVSRDAREVRESRVRMDAGLLAPDVAALDDMLPPSTLVPQGNAVDMERPVGRGGSRDASWTAADAGRERGDDASGRADAASWQTDVAALDVTAAKRARMV